MKMDFEEYGTLEWLEPDEYWKGDWSPEDIAIGTDDERYDIVFSRRNQEIRFTNI